jgi:hypothetical protein
MFCGQCSEETADALDVLSRIKGIYKYSYEVRVTFRRGACLGGGACGGGSFVDGALRTTCENFYKYLGFIAFNTLCRLTHLHLSQVIRGFSHCFEFSTRWSEPKILQYFQNIT